VVFGINSSSIVNRKEIVQGKERVLGFASHYFTPSYLQCSPIYLKYYSLPSYYIYVYNTCMVAKFSCMPELHRSAV